jgi:diacylglycerol O-acyltransferase
MMNVAVSGVVGPRERGHSEGAAVSEIYSTGVLSPGAPVIITAWSCVDQLDIAALTDDQTLNDPPDATDALIAAFAELRSAAGVSA